MKPIFRRDWDGAQYVARYVPYKLSIIYDSTAQTARVVDGEPDGSVYGTDYRPDAERYAAAIEAAARHVPAGTPLSVECGDTRCALRYEPPDVAARVAFDLDPLQSREEQERRSRDLRAAAVQKAADFRARYGADWRRHAREQTAGESARTTA